ncbi:MAG: hypothetical protein AB8H79_04875 [Myxococcota bacterium]
MFRRLTCVVALCACGSSVNVKQHLTMVCEAGSAVRTDVDLVNLDLKAVRPPEAMPIEVRTEGWRVGRHGVQTVAEMSDRVRRELANARLIRDLNEDDSPPMPIRLMVDKAVASERVMHTLAAVQASGASDVQVVVASAEAYALPAYPDPGFAAELKAKMAEVSPEQRASMTAQVLTEELAFCPGGQKAFAASGVAAPDQRCALIAYGLSEELPSCYGTSSSRVVTAVHVLMEPSSSTKVTYFSVRLSPEGDPLSLSGPLWSDAAEPLSAMAGKTLNAAPPPVAIE